MDVYVLRTRCAFGFRAGRPLGRDGRSVLAKRADKPFAAPQVTHTSPSPAGGLAQVTLSLLLVLAAISPRLGCCARLRGLGNAGRRRARTSSLTCRSDRKSARCSIQVGSTQIARRCGAGPGERRCMCSPSRVH